MPELPDVEMFRKIAQQVVGKKIAGISLKEEPMVKLPLGIENDVQNKKISRVLRHGKYLLLMVGKSNLVLHFGMTGYLTLEDDLYAVMQFHFSRSMLTYASKRKLGKIEAVEDWQAFTRKYGPDALTVSEQEFKQILLNSTKQAIKPLLMDQQKLAGLGNVYTDEILFQAKIHPLRDHLNEKELRQLYRIMRSVLTTAIARDANPARFPATYLTRQRKKRPCPKCGGTIKKIQVRGRSTYYCEKHQVLN